MITTSLPAGLNGDTVEMYGEKNVLMCLADSTVIPVVKIERVKSKVFRHMVNRPSAHKRMIEWKGSDVDDQINQYGQCLWGVFNMIPDIDENGNLSTPEFVQCANRFNCPHKGIICANPLSTAEERIIPYLLWSDRIIGQFLNLSEFTVKTHFKNIKTKLGFQTKSQLIDWAKDNGIELCK